MSAHWKGCFITLEGVEGVGKTTNLAHVCEYLRRELAGSGCRVIQTREPGGTPLAEDLRELLLATREEKVADLTELLLMFAGRAQHLAQVIRPALAAGDWVVCDRFTDATYAYQGGGRDLPKDQIAQLEALVHADLQPDLTLYLDLPWDLAVQRIANRELDRMESEPHAFFNAVRQAYLARAQAQPRFRVISAAESLAVVQQNISQLLDDFMHQRESG